VHALASGKAESLDLARRLLGRFQALPGVRAVGESLLGRGHSRREGRAGVNALRMVRFA
jgi:hypothetical protein